MAESGAEGEFRVSDRRRRVEEDEPVLPPPAPEPPPRDSRPAPAAQEAPRPAAEGSRSLEGLFIMLASSAAMALGESADPETGQSHRDPAAAAGAIDLLVLLREKTEGNRTPRETQVLGELIYDLQLRYVAATAPRP